MVAYYGDVSSAGPLTAIVITANVISSTNITLSRVVGPKSYTGTSLTGVLRATTLDNGDVVVAYSDNLSNNGVTCVQVTINMLTNSLLFGGVLAITTGETAKYVFPTGTMNIQLVTIGNGFQFMVMFSDLELDGALVAAVGEVT